MSSEEPIRACKSNLRRIPQAAPDRANMRRGSTLRGAISTVNRAPQNDNNRARELGKAGSEAPRE